MIFPLARGTSYTICGYWGDPRPNGRTHQGVDLCCRRGTPLLAVADGRLEQSVDALGGTTSRLYPADGSHWYYAHESGYAAGGVPRQVRAGDVLGFCGSSGDAQAALPHLHIGHYVGGVAVDPTADLQAAAHVELPRRSSRVFAVAFGALLGVAAAGAGIVVLQRANAARDSRRAFART